MASNASFGKGNGLGVQDVNMVSKKPSTDLYLRGLKGKNEEKSEAAANRILKVMVATMGKEVAGTKDQILYILRDVYGE